MQPSDFKKLILHGIPDTLPIPQPYDQEVSHAPIRKDILSKDEKKLALRNALRYFDKKHHAVLASEFAEELKKYGRIYIPIPSGIHDVCPVDP
jgi:urocanate hydratase